MLKIKKERQDLLLFVAGIVLFFTSFRMLPALEPLVDQLKLSPLQLLLLMLIIYIAISVFLVKKVRYMGLGFILSIPAVALFIALFAFEMWIHPPDEE